MRYTTSLCHLLFFLVPASVGSFVTASNHGSFETIGLVKGGAQAVAVERSTQRSQDKAIAKSKLYSSNTIDQSSISVFESAESNTARPLRVLFLSADTGGGHRASAEALAKQFLIQYPGSTYELADLWTDHGCLPYRTLVNSYKHLSANPRQWRLFFHLTNNNVNEFFSQIHSKFMCGKAIKNRIAAFEPDVVVSVHPTMNHCPRVQVRKISKEQGKHIPFFTVVTDLGSAHITWFDKGVNKVYVASDRLSKLARKMKGTPKENIVLTGLPIRHGFAVQADKLGDRTSQKGKEYQKSVRTELGLNADKPVVLVMGGGEGVGSLSEIVDQLYAKLTLQGVDATICVVCGRNEKLRSDLETRDWDAVLKESEPKPSRRRRLLKFLKRRRSKQIEENVRRAEPTIVESHLKGKVDVVGLGFVTNMPEYMVAADILVSKAGPGTIAEAASVGLPVMLTSFLPGQEAGNVDVVLESGYGDYCEDPSEIASEVGYWLQDQDLLKSMSLAATTAGHPYAADEIVSDIGSQTVAWMNLNEK